MSKKLSIKITYKQTINIYLHRKIKIVENTNKIEMPMIILIYATVSSIAHRIL